MRDLAVKIQSSPKSQSDFTEKLDEFLCVVDDLQEVYKTMNKSDAIPCTNCRTFFAMSLNQPHDAFS